MHGMKNLKFSKNTVTIQITHNNIVVLDKVKVKVTLVEALRLCTGCTAHRGSRGIALLFHDQRQ